MGGRVRSEIEASVDRLFRPPGVRVLSEVAGGETRTHSETRSEAQRAREVGGAHGHMGPHTMQALRAHCI